MRMARLASLLCTLVATAASAQVRAPWGPQPFEDDEPPRPHHSIVTLWADALESLHHENPILRWQAARLAAVHPQAFDDETLLRAWLRERDLRVRVALKRTLIARGRGDDLSVVGTGAPEGCALSGTALFMNEARSSAELETLLRTVQSAAEQRALTHELALALRREAFTRPNRKSPVGTRAQAFAALRTHAGLEEATLLRAIARDASLIAELNASISHEEPTQRRDAVEALHAFADPQHTALLGKALKRETHVDVARALLVALRWRGAMPDMNTLVALTQRIAVQGVNAAQQGAPTASDEGFALEHVRVVLQSTERHELLYEQAQQKLRDWVSPSNPLAGMALELFGAQPHVPAVAIAPYIDDERTYVRESALRVILARPTPPTKLLNWLRLDALDAQTLATLQNAPASPPNPSAPHESSPLLIAASRPVLVSWTGGQELGVPNPAGLVFLSEVGTDASVCQPTRGWFSPNDPIRDL